MEDKLEKIYKAYVDLEDNAETKEENLKTYEGLVDRLRKTDLLKSWLDHDQTKIFLAFIKNEYKTANLLLATKENLTESERSALWHRKKTFGWIMDLCSKDPEQEKENLKAEVDQYLSNV